MKRILIYSLLLIALSSVTIGQKPPPPPVRIDMAPGNGDGKKTPVSKERKRITSSIASPAYSIDIEVTNEVFHVTYEVNEDGTFVRRQKVRRRFGDEVAAGPLRNWNSFFNSKLSSVEVEDAFIERVGGKREPFPENMVSIRRTPQSEAAPDYSSVSEVKIDFSEIQADDVVEFTLITRMTRPLFDGVFDILDVFSPFETYKSAFVEISAPESMKLNASQKGFGEGRRISIEGGRQLWRWDLEDSKAKMLEVGMPDMFSIAPVLVVTNIPDSKTFGTLYARESTGTGIVTPQIQALGDSITKGVVGKREKAELIYSWVNKNIRYLLVFLDRGGWVPRTSEEILKNRFGDCKDYTVLMQALLKSQDIESEPVVLRVDGQAWLPSTPAFSFFNHMILYVPELNEFADATAPDTTFGQLAEQLKGKSAVRLAGDFATVLIPKGESSTAVVSSKALLKYQPSGDVSMFSSISLDEKTGAPFKSMIGKPEAAALGPALRMIYAARNLAVNGEVRRLESNAEQKTIELDFDGSFAGYHDYSNGGTLKLPPVNIFFDESIFTGLSKLEKRTTPLLVENLDLSEETTVEFPAGVTLNLPLENTVYENRLGSYERELSYAGGILSLKRKIKIKKSEISVDEFPEFRDFLNSWLGSDAGTISYTLASGFKSTKKKKPASPNAESIVEEIISNSPFFSSKEMTSKEASALEKALRKNPEDKESRKRLISYYDGNSFEKSNAAKIAPHLIWLIRNHPKEWAGASFLWHLYLKKNDRSYLAVKNELLLLLIGSPDDPDTVLDVAEFVQDLESYDAVNMLVAGSLKFPEDYRFPHALFGIYNSDLSEPEEDREFSKVDGLAEKTADIGEKALSLMKSNRTKASDTEFLELLLDLSALKMKLNDHARTKDLATDMILIFGVDTSFSGFDTATHTGNILLGKLAMIEGDPKKAGEYLLIAIRAPLRKKESWFVPDMELAKLVYDAGGKETVAEYLDECLKIWSFNNLETSGDEEERNAVVKWRDEIKSGRKPSFDYVSP